MTKVSSFFQLGRDQSTLDFVDVDVENDTRVFIDPTAIRAQDGDWSHECVTLLTTFFEEVVIAVAAQDSKRLQNLLGNLGEPNETHLGLSRGRSRGRGLGSERMDTLVTAFQKSKAASSGLLEDLEDSALFVPGIGQDILSDMTTHILRGALVGYSQFCASYYGIPLVEQYLGPIWNPASREWQFDQRAEIPRGPDGPLLLVPKSIVREHPSMDAGSYYRGYLRPHLYDQEMSTNSSLIRTLRDGRRKINLGDIDAKYGSDKPSIVDHTLQFRDALKKYKNQAKASSKSPMPNSSLPTSPLSVGAAELASLLADVRQVAPGTNTASIYHRRVEKLLTALFYPDLGNMQLEEHINQGRKRIDISYDNLASSGFFHWVQLHYHVAVLPVECKNYSVDPGNPEVDQIAMRLGPTRGEVGLLVCRELDNKPLLIQRCRDAALQGHGFVIALDDNDLVDLVQEVVDNPATVRGRTYRILRQRMNQIS